MTSIEALEEGEHVEVEVLVDGQPLRPGAPCEHRLGFTEQVTVGLRNAPDDEQTVVHREVLLKLRCRDCGVPMRFKVETARVSRTAGDLGIVVDVEPLEEDNGQGSTPLGLLSGLTSA